GVSCAKLRKSRSCLRYALSVSKKIPDVLMSEMIPHYERDPVPATIIFNDAQQTAGINIHVHRYSGLLHNVPPRSNTLFCKRHLPVRRVFLDDFPSRLHCVSRRFRSYPVILEPYPGIYGITNEENDSHPRFGGLFNDRDDVLNPKMRIEW